MFKVLLVKNDMKEIENLLNKGWAIIAGFNHPQGGVFVLQQDIKKK